MSTFVLGTKVSGSGESPLPPDDARQPAQRAFSTQTVSLGFLNKPLGEESLALKLFLFSRGCFLKRYYEKELDSKYT